MEESSWINRSMHVYNTKLWGFESQQRLNLHMFERLGGGIHKNLK